MQLSALHITAFDENKARHASGSRGNDSDLTKGVPDANIDQGDVDDIGAVADVVAHPRVLHADGIRYATVHRNAVAIMTISPNPAPSSALPARNRVGF